jgi:hypothetical protein
MYYCDNLGLSLRLPIRIVYDVIHCYEQAFKGFMRLHIRQSNLFIGMIVHLPLIDHYCHDTTLIDLLLLRQEGWSLNPVHDI